MNKKWHIRLYFVELLTYAISISLTIEIHKINIDTSKVTNKQYYKIILFKKFLSNKTNIFRELLPNTTDYFQKNCTRQYFFLFHIWTYSKPLLTGISANSTFRTVFDFKKLKIIYCWDIWHFFISICLSQIGFTNQKLTLLRTNTYQAF